MCEIRVWEGWGWCSSLTRLVMCRPSEELIRLGAGATLLVHEATLEENMLQEAIDKRHCTTREALSVGLQMEAERIVLTHFSQRYPKVPSFDGNALTPGHPASTSTSASTSAAGALAGAGPASASAPSSSSALPSIAFDLMCVPFSRLWALPTFLPAIKYLFPGGSAADEEDSAVVSSVMAHTHSDDEPSKSDAELEDSSDDEANRAAAHKAKLQYQKQQQQKQHHLKKAQAAVAATTQGTAAAPSNGGTKQSQSKNKKGEKRKHSNSTANTS